MKKGILVQWWTLVAVALFLTPWQVQGQSQADLSRKLDLLRAYPDLIVVNGKITTMDASNREVQAMAVKNNRVLAVGTNDEIRFLAGPNTQVIDAKGRRVLPGFIDSHTHPHLWAVEHWLGGEGDFAAKKYNDPQLQIFYAMGNDATEVLRNLERIVRERSQLLGPGKWIWVTLFGGKNIPESRRMTYPLFQQTGGQPGTVTRQYVNTLAPNNPLLVHSSEAIGPEVHNDIAAKEMVKLLGYEASGLMTRTGVLYDILMRGRDEEKVDFLKRELLECVAAAGVTTFGNHYYGSPSIMKTYNILYNRGEMPVRWAWYVGTNWGNQLGGGPNTSGSDSGDMQFFYRNLGDFRGIGNDYIWNGGVSNEAWEGGLTCTIAKPLAQPKDPGGIRRDCNANPTKLDEAGGYQNVKAALENGLRISYLHTYSDGTYDSLLKMLDDAVASGKVTVEQVRALRIGTEHNPIIRPDQIKRLAYYDIRPAFNGYQVQGDIKGGQFLKAYGEQYMNWMAPMKSMLDAGGHPIFNTDAHLHKVPYYAKDMDYPEEWNGNIWGFVEFFVTRKMPSDGVTYNRAEAMDRATLMRAATLWGAQLVMNEKNIGSLEVGKLADFIVIDKDYFTIPEDQIHTIKNLLTVTGGKTVFKSPEF